MLRKTKDADVIGSANGASDKRKKFVNIAGNRTRNAMRAIRTIAKLGNKNAYEYSDVDVKKIAAALTKEVEALKARMTSTGGKEMVEFEL